MKEINADFNQAIKIQAPNGKSFIINFLDADGNVHIEFDNEVYDGPLEFLLRI